MPKRKNIPNDADKCIGLKRDGMQCDMPKVDGQSFCPAYHSELNEYSQKQIDSIKRCANCKNYRAFDPDERYCIHCTKKLGSNKVKPKKKSSKPQSKCNGKSKTGDQCGQKAIKGLEYCTYHKHLSDFTGDELQNVKQCIMVKCGKYDILDNDKLCSICSAKRANNPKVEKKPKKPKAKIYKCRGYSEDQSRCRFKVLTEEIFCKYHIDMKDYTDEMLDINNQTRCTYGPQIGRAHV